MVSALYISSSCSFFNDLWDAILYVCCEIHRGNLGEGCRDEMNHGRHLPRPQQGAFGIGTLAFHFGK